MYICGQRMQACNRERVQSLSHLAHDYRHRGGRQQRRHLRPDSIAYHVVILHILNSAVTTRLL